MSCQPAQNSLHLKVSLWVPHWAGVYSVNRASENQMHIADCMMKTYKISLDHYLPHEELMHHKSGMILVLLLLRE